MDQVIIGGAGTNDLLGISLAERTYTPPKKKSVKETIPFSNKVYDFSKINGELYWEEGKVEYVFEILEDTMEGAKEKERNFLSWVMNVTEEEIKDPFIAGYHFVGTFDSVSVNDSEIEKIIVTVMFATYPYLISDQKKVYSQTVDDKKTIEIKNNSAHPVIPDLIAEMPVSLTLGNTTFSIPKGTTTSSKIRLEPGENQVTLKNTENPGTISIEFYEEVF